MVMDAERVVAKGATPSRETVVVIGNGPTAAERAKAALRQPNRDVHACGSVSEAFELLPTVEPDLMVVSLDLQALPGRRMLAAVRELYPEVPVVALSGNATVDFAVQAMRAGAVDYLEWPSDPERLARTAHRALMDLQATRALEETRESVKDRYGFKHLLSRSPRMLRVFDQIRAVAATDATVLIRGETGTGKELVAQAIHERSRRRENRLISINCGAFTESLLESELFGHEKGSFTGATGRQRGVFELADSGSLFLDELGETSLNVQVNLLRVLEEMAFRRIGGHDLVNVNVRIIAATNVDLESAVRDGRFREDLFYRLNVFPIILPPLRRRPEDVPLLLRHFLEESAKDYGVEPPVVAADAMESIRHYSWPGNVRQLRSFCERWVIVAGGGTLSRDLLPKEMLDGSRASGTPSALVVDETIPMKDQVDRVSERIERIYLHRQLLRFSGHLQNTAKAAGITRRTLYNKMRQYGLDAADYRGK